MLRLEKDDIKERGRCGAKQVLLSLFRSSAAWAKAWSKYNDWTIPGFFFFYFSVLWYHNVGTLVGAQLKSSQKNIVCTHGSLVTESLYWQSIQTLLSSGEMRNEETRPEALSVCKTQNPSALQCKSWAHLLQQHGWQHPTHTSQEFTNSNELKYICLKMSIPF